MDGFGKVRGRRLSLGYQNEWLLLEAEDDIDDVEHRPPTEEFLFYRAVTEGDVEAVRLIS